MKKIVLGQREFGAEFKRPEYPTRWHFGMECGLGTALYSEMRAGSLTLYLGHCFLDLWTDEETDWDAPLDIVLTPPEAWPQP